MKRNKNIDIVRAFAVIAVVIYHIYAITGVSFSLEPIQILLKYGGEYGVAVFFILSGFSIYVSLNRKKENFTYHNFIAKRLERILPQYYISLIFLLLFTSAAVYLSSYHIYNLFSHMFLFHDLYPSSAGAISGVCWTLGVIFQFYLISPFLYKAIEKKPKLTLFTSLIFSIGIKAFLYHYVLIPQQASFEYYFSFGKALYTSIDIFVLGMFLGKIITIPEDNKKIVKNIIGLIISFIVFFAWIYIDCNRISIWGINTGIYSDCIHSYIWHSGLAIILSFMIYFFSKIKFNESHPIIKSLLFIAQYEYGIYIWHLILIRALSDNSEFIRIFITYQRKMTYVILFSLSIGTGVLMTEIVDNINFKEMYLKFKPLIKKLINYSIVLIVILLTLNSFTLLPKIYNNFKKIYNKNITFHTPSEVIAQNSEVLIPENAKYMYLDSRTTGYQYFWEIRYFLAPREALHFNIYVDLINDGNIENIYAFLKETDVDYFVIRDCPILEEYFNCNYDEIKGSVYKKNKTSTCLDDLFIEVK